MMLTLMPLDNLIPAHYTGKVYQFAEQIAAALLDSGHSPKVILEGGKVKNPEVALAYHILFIEWKRLVKNGDSAAVPNDVAVMNGRWYLQVDPPTPPKQRSFTDRLGDRYGSAINEWNWTMPGRSRRGSL